MITIKFNNDQTLHLTSIYMEDIINSLKYREILAQYSFDDNLDFEHLIFNTHLTIYYHQSVNLDTFNPLYNIEDLETILKCLEQLYLYQRKFPLLQMDYYPLDQVTIYTYSQVWEADFEKFREAPNKDYNWDNLPTQLYCPTSNMQVQYYNISNHIALIYHYYTL